MTIEKLKELMQTRMDYFEQHLSDETATAQLKARPIWALCRTRLRKPRFM